MKCWKCNEEISGKLFPIGKRVYCKICHDEELEEIENEKKLFEEIKRKRMFRRAIQILEDQSFPIYDYKDAITVVDEYFAEHIGRFRSSHELVAAIVLVGNRIKIKPNAKIGKIRVDFVIKEMKCILEIDGYMHDNRRLADAKRDLGIKQVLRNEWEVVRIPTRYIEQNVKKLVEAIKEILEEKRAGNV